MNEIKCPHCGSTTRFKFKSQPTMKSATVIELPCECECECGFSVYYDITAYSDMQTHYYPAPKRAIITKAEENRLEFSDGTIITADHCQDCCECNYAKFDDLDDIAMNTVFDMNKLEIEVVEGSGIRIGNKPSKMFFVPCYSDQNGYYSSDLDIYINGVEWAHIEDCEMI